MTELPLFSTAPDWKTQIRIKAKKTRKYNTYKASPCKIEKQSWIFPLQLLREVQRKHQTIFGYTRVCDGNACIQKIWRHLGLWTNLSPLSHSWKQSKTQCKILQHFTTPGRCFNRRSHNVQRLAYPCTVVSGYRDKRHTGYSLSFEWPNDHGNHVT